MKESWSVFLSERKNVKLFFISVLSVCTILFLFFHFLAFNEMREGFTLSDPLLNFLNPVELSYSIFTITYGLCVLGLFMVLRDPRIFISLISAYSLLTLLRMLCLYILPLEPPEDIIPLKDIFLDSSFYGGRQNLKDLFFSGHTATVFLFFFVFKNKVLRIIFGNRRFVSRFSFNATACSLHR